MAFRIDLVRLLQAGVLLACAALPQFAAGQGPANILGENITRIFADDGWADVRVIFGYEQAKADEAPCDPARALKLTKYLETRGFQCVYPTEEVAATLGVPQDTKNLRVFEGYGQPGQRLRVSIMWSSASSNAAVNLGSGYTQQLLRSAEALKFMKKAASSAEVMMYLSHSRSGGGPDTFPPETLGINEKGHQRVDYSQYRRTRPGLAALAPSFSKAKYPPTIVAWTGCKSDVHFRSWLGGLLKDKDFPTCLILATRLINYDFKSLDLEGTDEGLMVAARLIDALMTRQSQSDLESRLLACEMEQHRKPLAPAWKLSTLPGKKYATPPSAPLAPAAPVVAAPAAPAATVPPATSVAGGN